MSEFNVDILLRAREEALQTLREVNEEIRRTGRIQEESRPAYMDARRQIVDQNRALNTLRMAYREEHETLSIAAGALQSLSSTVGKGLRMYEQYNVAQIRTNQLSKAVKEAQERYNKALSESGPNSEKVTRAYEDLQEASERLAQAQQQNTFQFVGFALQVPSFLHNILQMRDNFKLLAFQLKDINWASWASGASRALGGTAASVALLAGKVGILVGLLYAIMNIYGNIGKMAEEKKTLWENIFGVKPPFEIPISDLYEYLFGIKAKPTTPTGGYAPSIPAWAQRGPLAFCPYCGAPTGSPHKSWCPLLAPGGGPSASSSLGASHEIIVNVYGHITSKQIAREIWSELRALSSEELRAYR